MKREDYLPLGSIVLLKGGVQKVIIISRAIVVNRGDKEVFYDYGAALYPDGLVGDQVAYFNNDSISKVVFTGYTDIDDENFVDNVNEFLATTDIEKAVIE